MANNVGNISVGLSLSNEQFALKMSESTAITERFTQRAAMAGAAAAGASGGLSRFSSAASGIAPAMAQSAMGIGDFVSQLGSRGLGGGLQAMANNVQQLGAGFGPMGLAVSAGVGVAVTALGVYMEASDKAAKAQKKLGDESAAAWKKIAAEAENASGQMRESIRKNQGGVADIASGREMPDTHADFKKRIKDEEQRLRDLQRERQGLINELNRALPFGIAAQVPGGFAQRAGVDVPGMGVVPVADATLNTGPLTMRALGKAANARKLEMKTIPGMEGWTGWAAGLIGMGGPRKEQVQTPVFDPKTIGKIGEIEKRLMATNEEIRAAQERGLALARQEPQVLKKERSESERQQRLAEIQQKAKDESGLAKADQKDMQGLQNRADSLTKSFETTMERMTRQVEEVNTLQRSGALSPESAAQLRQRIESQSMRQPNSLPTFTANSQETLSRINAIIRGTRDTKVVEKNTADTAKAAAKLVGKMEDVRAAISRNSVKIARF